MKIPINKGDGSINIQELEQNLLGDANWIPRLNTLVLAEINNNLRAIAQQLEESESRKIMRIIRDSAFENIKFQPVGFAVDRDGLPPIMTPRVKPNYKEKRPWGGFEVLAEGEGYKVKKIWVNPGEAISLQSHKLRQECWTIVRGVGGIVDEEAHCTNYLHPGAVKQIEAEEKHRIENDTSYLLEFIEVQTGECKEDDIIRYEDKYGRV